MGNVQCKHNATDACRTASRWIFINAMFEFEYTANILQMLLLNFDEHKLLKILMWSTEHLFMLHAVPST